MTQEQSPQLQTRLKSILQLSVQTLKPRLRTKTQISQLQDILLDYQNNEELAQIIENVIKLIQKYQPKNNNDQDNKNMVEEEEYQKLELSVQSLEARHRAYIKAENQMKLYCEELEAKVRELEESKNQLVVSTKKVILDLKRDNQNLVDKIKALTQSHTNKQPNERPTQPNKNFRKQSSQSIDKPDKPDKPDRHDKHDKLPKTLKSYDRAENSLRSKLQQYQEVIESIQASRGRKNSVLEQKEKIRHEVK